MIQLFVYNNLVILMT